MDRIICNCGRVIDIVKDSRLTFKTFNGKAVEEYKCSSCRRWTNGIKVEGKKKR